MENEVIFNGDSFVRCSEQNRPLLGDTVLVFGVLHYTEGKLCTVVPNFSQQSPKIIFEHLIVNCEYAPSKSGCFTVSRFASKVFKKL